MKVYVLLEEKKLGGYWFSDVIGIYSTKELAMKSIPKDKLVSMVIHDYIVKEEI